LNFFRHLITYFAAKNAILLDIQFIETLGDAHVFFTPHCDSTQLEIQRFIAAGAMGHVKVANPVALYTHFQHKGVGQRGSEWTSDPGLNALLTIAFPLSNNRDLDLVVVNKALSVSVASTLQSVIGGSIKIKWPNDLIYNDLKLGGMLMETVQIEQRKYLLLGLGINVNQMVFPGDTQATSLMAAQNSDLIIKPEDRVPIAIEALTVTLLEGVLAAWKQPLTLANLYPSMLYKAAERVTLLDVKTQETFDVTLIGVNQLGQVCVQLANGDEVAYHHGQVRMKYICGSTN
jgi:BirA family biotin operon repressor/biotin-[acetyl-CoA-carboxylase] ligase